MKCYLTIYTWQFQGAARYHIIRKLLGKANDCCECCSKMNALVITR
jgi:hypothetical protein